MNKRTFIIVGGILAGLIPIVASSLGADFEAGAMESISTDKDI